jgi:hypothetical protein
MWKNRGGGSAADSYSCSTTTGGATAEIFEEHAVAEEEEATEKVFVAVPEQHKSGKSLLTWTPPSLSVADTWAPQAASVPFLRTGSTRTRPGRAQSRDPRDFLTNMCNKLL